VLLGGGPGGLGSGAGGAGLRQRGAELAQLRLAGGQLGAEFGLDAGIRRRAALGPDQPSEGEPNAEAQRSGNKVFYQRHGRSVRGPGGQGQSGLPELPGRRKVTRGRQLPRKAAAIPSPP
jgi:hypothetical protein